MKWKSRFLSDRLEGLEDLYRSGALPKFGQVIRLEIISTACDPSPKENGMNGWTTDRLKEEVIKRGIVDNIGRSTVHRILQKAELKPHRIVDGFIARILIFERR